MDLDTILERERKVIEKALNELLKDHPPVQGDLGNDVFDKALRHAVKAGGKRIRPILTMLCAKVCGAKARSQKLKDALRAATAIELLHSYTLVHDDLPAMDNDTERRGAPSVWAKYGESTAILVGDYLQALAFEQLNDCEEAPHMYEAFANAAKAVIRGQVTDIAVTKLARSEWTEEILRHVFLNKTAYLIATACLLGGLAAEADEEDLQALFDYGLYVGIAFQYIDDILDAEQAKEGNELTALALSKDARQDAIRYTMEAVETLEELPFDTSVLEAFAKSLLTRLV